VCRKACAFPPTPCGGYPTDWCRRCSRWIFSEYLLEIKQADQAVIHLERAIQAPARPGRQVADAGRREEARALLEKAKGK
jgi:hypothetical protein